MRTAGGGTAPSAPLRWDLPAGLLPARGCCQPRLSHRGLGTLQMLYPDCPCSPERTINVNLGLWMDSFQFLDVLKMPDYLTIGKSLPFLENSFTSREAAAFWES